MAILTQSLLSSFGATRHFDYTNTTSGAPSGSGGWSGGSGVLASGGTYAELRVYKPANWNNQYQFRLYYNDGLIFDTGLSNSVNPKGQPKNWPPPLRGGQNPQGNNPPQDEGDSNGYGDHDVYDETDNDEGSSTDFEWYKVPVYTGNGGISGTAVGGNNVKEFSYLGPDLYWGNNLSYIGSSSSYDSYVHKGAHFLIGDYQFRRTTVSLNSSSKRWSYDFGSGHYGTDYTSGDARWYWDVIKLSCPPSIYRNTLAYEDSTDADFNDGVFILKEGDGFFTGGFLKNSTSPTSKSYTYGTTTSNWGYFSGNTFVANTTGTYKFNILRRAGNLPKMLLYKGSGSNDHAELVADSGSNSIRNNVTFTLNAGTYEVALTDNNNVGGNVIICSLDPDKFPSNLLT